MTFWTASDLQLSLIALGSAGVVAVLAYNKWQEARQRKLAQRMFGADHADVLLEGGASGESAAHPSAESAESAESDLAYAGNETDEADAAHGSMDPYDRIDPAMPEPVEERIAEEAASAAGREEDLPIKPLLELADPDIDCLVSLSFATPVVASLFWAAQWPLLAAFEGRLRWIGAHAGNWRQISAHDGATCHRLIGALLLADRTGPLGEVELAGLFSAIRQLAEKFQAELELPEAAGVLARAQEIDTFCASVDWRLGLNVLSRSGSAIDFPRLVYLVEAAGFTRRDDGLYEARDQRGQPQLTLACLGGLPLAGDEALPIAGLTLSIDVPRVEDGVAAFDRLLVFARDLTAAADAMLVDDQRAPLGDAALGAIRAKIGEFQAKMAAQDIPAGGRRALRLYS